MAKLDWNNARLRSAALFALALLIYLPAAGAFFHSDDFALVRAVRDGGPFGIWSGAGQPFFRPLVSLTLWLDHALSGLNPLGYHLTNIGIHGFNSALVGVVAAQAFRRFKFSEDKVGRVAWLSGALFAVLSCHSEAVTWISGRTDALATLFALLALYMALREKLGWSMLMFGLSLLAKESGFTLPFLLLFLVLLRREEKALVRPAVAWLLVGVLYFGLRYATIGQVFGGYGTASYLGAGPATLVQNGVVYFSKSVFPGSLQNLSLWPFTGGVLSGLVASPKIAAGALAAILILFVGDGVRRGWFRDSARLRMGVLLLVGFFILALPALPLGMSAFTTEGERYLYLPSVTICILAAAAVVSLQSSRRQALLGGSFLLIYGAALFATNQNWIHAGNDARLSLEALRSLPGDQEIALASIPDSYRGAYVLRNGLEDASRMFLRREAPKYLTTYAYQEPKSVPGYASAGPTFVLSTPPGQYAPLYRTPYAEVAGITVVNFSPIKVVCLRSVPVVTVILGPGIVIPIP